MKIPWLVFQAYRLYHRWNCRFCYPTSRWTHLNAEQRGAGPSDAFYLAIILLTLALLINMGIGYLVKGS